MKWFTTLETSNQITLISSIVTAIISIVSVWIALRALKVTKQSVLEANRPYVVIYLETIDIGYYVKYLVVKNFGKSGTLIKSASCNQTFTDTYLNNFINDLSNRYIAPGQSFTTVIEPETGREIMKFNIEYSDSIATYHENFELNTTSFKHQVRQKNSKSTMNEFENKLIQAFHDLKKSNF